jgi:AraC family ethanolamine operon transcriptional activator
VAVVFGPQFVQRHGLDVAKLEGLFMAPLTCQQNALFSRWLSGTLTRLSSTFDPISRDALTQQLLDDCLFILDNACVCLDRSRCSAAAKSAGSWCASANGRRMHRKKPSICWSWRRLRGAAAPVAAGFKTYTGMSPAQWLRLRRLNGARRELLSSAQTTVAEVAMNWSFWHLGRFSSSYRALFKELPSETPSAPLLNARLELRRGIGTRLAKPLPEHNQMWEQAPTGIAFQG